MMIIGIILIVLGLGVLLMSWRGRVVARGAFCKKCRFDLAGLDLELPDSKCPECGNEVSLPSNRRGMIRRSSKLGLIAAVLVFIGGIVTTWIWASANASVILGVLPDSLVLTLTDFGMDEALDELVIRFSQVSSPLSASQIEHAIELGLAHQADTTLVWDPRWGEVLMIAAQTGHMSDEQIGAYIVNGYAIKIDTRKTLYENAQIARTKFTTQTARIGSITGGTIPFSMKSRVVQTGIVGHEEELRPTGTTPSSTLYDLRIPSNRGVMSSVGYGSIALQLNDQLPVAGEKLNVFCESEMNIRSTTDEREIVNHRSRAEMTISFVDRDTELITLVAPIDGQTSLSSKIFIDKEIVVANPLPDDSESIPHQTVIDFYVLLKDVRQSVSYQVYIRTELGDEIPIGTVMSLASYGHASFGMQRSLSNMDKAIQERVRIAIAEMIERGEATILMRVDPEGALMDPDIIEILDQDLIFEHVVVRSAPIGQFQSNSDGSAQYPAEALIEDEIEDE